MAEPVNGRVLAFTIPGRLGSWQRARINHGTGTIFTPGAMRSDQGVIKHFAAEEMRRGNKVPLVGPLKLVVRTFRTWPKSWSAKKRNTTHWITGKPDFDNTLKLIADALNKVVYLDDAQIADGHHIKTYAHSDCVVVELEELGG